MSISVAPGSPPPCRRIRQASGGVGETGAAYPVTGSGFWGFWVLGLGEPQGLAMNRSLVVAMGLALAAGAMHSHAALAQSPFPPAPQQSSPFPPPPQQSQLPADSTSPIPAPPRQSTFPAAPQQSVFPSGTMQGGPPTGGPQMGGPPPQSGICANFPKLRDEAKAKAELVSAVGKRKGDRKDMCAAVQNFTAAEDKVVKFLEDNKVAW